VAKGRADACNAQYHAGCVKAGPPFVTRLGNGEGLVLPWQVPVPHYVCELCVVRGQLQRELRHDVRDIVLLLLERMRQIDFLHNWAKRTLGHYGAKLRYLARFQEHFGVQVLVPATLIRPVQTPAIPLVWSELYYSLRQTKGEDGLYHPIKFASVRPLRSAAALFYTLDMQDAFPRRVMRDRHRRGIIQPYVSPTDELYTSFGASGMARRMGTETKKSWALSHIHIAFMDSELDRLFQKATGDEAHELACAGTINLLAYLGWLRSGEVFGLQLPDVTILIPEDGPTRGLPPGGGAVEARLLTATKSDQTITADVIVAFTTLSGLGLGRWFQRLQGFTPRDGEHWFSTKTQPRWTSQYFRNQYAYPILEMQRLGGEPSLSTFTCTPGKRICDKIYSIHSWRRGGRSRVSRVPRHNEPKPKGARRATPDEVYEHGRWQHNEASENMPQRYNQWDLSDRILITLCCM
jgi:hypothetical protein